MARWSVLWALWVKWRASWSCAQWRWQCQWRMSNGATASRPTPASYLPLTLKAASLPRHCHCHCHWTASSLVLWLSTRRRQMLFSDHICPLSDSCQGAFRELGLLPKRYLLYKFAKLYWPLLMSLETSILSALGTYFPQVMLAIFTPTAITILFPWQRWQTWESDTLIIFLRM